MSVGARADASETNIADDGETHCDSSNTRAGQLCDKGTANGVIGLARHEMRYLRRTGYGPSVLDSSTVTEDQTEVIEVDHLIVREGEVDEKGKEEE